jgi:CDP-paratose 2-epimerase
MSANRDRGAFQAPRILITGGAGFVGTNLAEHLLMGGTKLRIVDSLACTGSERNLENLLEEYSQRIEFIRADVRDMQAMRAAVAGIEHIFFHLAAQVAVTTSLEDPSSDFEVNARGTLNVLEAARRSPNRPSVLFTSTNKVYGTLPDLRLHAQAKRYVPDDERLRNRGLSESRGLDFHSPYGCSKGSAEQYVLDYARSFGLRTAVLRMSCIYGPHQNGTEDQGWVAHFVRRVLAGERITIYGDGLQVRDLLYVDDLVEAFERARQRMGSIAGRAFNIGGGPANSVSVLEVLDHIERLLGRQPDLAYDRLAPRRPALLRLGLLELQSGDGVAAANERHHGSRRAVRLVRCVLTFVRIGPAARPRRIHRGGWSTAGMSATTPRAPRCYRK